MAEVPATLREALEEAANATYEHTTIGQKGERTKTERYVHGADVRGWLIARAAEYREGTR